MAWYVRSSDNGDTHWAPKPIKGQVRAVCGARFDLLRRTVGTGRYEVTLPSALKREPHDPEQVCEDCAQKRERARQLAEDADETELAVASDG